MLNYSCWFSVEILLYKNYGFTKRNSQKKNRSFKNKKFITYSTKEGLLPTDKIESVMKPFAEKELITLGKFLQQLKKHKSLDQLLNLK